MTHTKKILSSSMIALAFVGTVHAQTAAATASPAPTVLEMSYNLGVVSDYRYRGISQTIVKPAVQAGLDGTYGGAYFGAWASNIKWIKDIGGDGNAELDIYAGYKFSAGADVTIDLGVLRYQYPKNHLATSANTTEVYLGASKGPVSVKYSQSTTDLFGYANSKNSAYLEANLDMEVAKGMNVVAHIGRQIVKNNSGAHTSDYKLGLTKEALYGKFSASVVGTNMDFLASTGKNYSKAGLVLGYIKTF